MNIKHIIVLIAFSCCVLSSSAQKIVKAEYFFDTDPGIGKGKALKIQPTGTTVTINDSAFVSGLLPGFHIFAIRFKNINNVWSLYENRSFYIQNETATETLPTITNAEYFFGRDPGIGNGTPVIISVHDTSVSFADSVLVNNAIPGNDTLVIRAKNAQGKWSILYNASFIVPLDTIDDDRDGLAVWQELTLYNTDPKNFDTNGDGLADGVNVFVGLNPKAADTDGDGISNIQEANKHTSPILSDTDMDGVPDNLDAFPLDPFRSMLPNPDGSHNAPVITLQEPF